MLALDMAEPDPDTFDIADDEAERRAAAAANADVQAGRVVSHVRVREWLKTVGTPDQKQTPYSWSVKDNITLPIRTTC